MNKDEHPFLFWSRFRGGGARQHGAGDPPYSWVSDQRGEGASRARDCETDTFLLPLSSRGMLLSLAIDKTSPAALQDLPHQHPHWFSTLHHPALLHETPSLSNFNQATATPRPPSYLVASIQHSSHGCVSQGGPLLSPPS